MQPTKSIIIDWSNRSQGWFSFEFMWPNVTYVHYIKETIINKQNFAVPAALGGPYDVIFILTVELNTWAANFTFKIEYGVNFICESEVVQINWDLVATGVHCYMLITTLMFIFPKIFSFIFFRLIWSQNLKFFKLIEIWYRGRLPYAYFDMRNLVQM